MEGDEKSLEERNIETLRRLKAGVEKAEVKEEREAGFGFQATDDEISYGRKTLRLTRELVIQGLGFRDKVPVPEWGPEAYLEVRPISDVEWGQVQHVLLEGVNIGEEILGPASELVDKERRARHLTLSFALSVGGEKWAVEEVGSLPTGVVDRIYECVAKLSGFRLAARERPSAR